MVQITTVYSWYGGMKLDCFSGLPLLSRRRSQRAVRFDGNTVKILSTEWSRKEIDARPVPPEFLIPRFLRVASITILVEKCLLCVQAVNNRSEGWLRTPRVYFGCRLCVFGTFASPLNSTVVDTW